MTHMKQKGFAMIFLLVAILIIGVIGGIGYQMWLSKNINQRSVLNPTISPIPTFEINQQSDNMTLGPNGLLPTLDPNNPVELDTARKLDLVSIRNAIEMYAVDHEGNYPNRLSILGEPYIKSVPKDPVTGKDYSFVFTPPDRYSLSATLSNGSTFSLYDLVTEDQIKSNNNQ